MCGITGFVGNGRATDSKRMADTLRHRGPDEEGFFHDDVRGVHLGFRRLSIIDLSTGSQPISNEDGSVTIVFNGEIYNHKELRQGLEGRHVFKTRTDTEVIVHLYEEMGEKCFEKFNGMFAIALWDRRNHRLVLARDRMGKKPLYWARFGKDFIFGSEVKAILAHPSARRTLNSQAVPKYFSHLSVPSPSTIFENIYKLEPGQMLVYETGTPPPARGGGEEGVGVKNIRLSYYWQPSYSTDASITENDALREIDRLLEDATRLRLAADVPVGIFLSGGIDSSLIAYYAARVSPRPITTFSIGFNESSYDESPYARRVAKHIGAEHHAEVFDSPALLKCIGELAPLIDEPISDASVLPTYLLSKFTRQHVTVALGGDGGDELFLGYPTFQAHALAEWYRRLPAWLSQKWIPALAQLLPVNHGGLSLDNKIKQFVGGASNAVTHRQQIWVSSFHERMMQDLFTPEFLSTVPAGVYHSDADSHVEALGLSSVNDITAYLYERYFLADLVLAKVDRASMAASLEVRAPFLDPRMVAYAHRIPRSLRLKWWQNKYLLKKLARGKIPDAVIDRLKQGFWTPIGPWLAGAELKDLVDTHFAKNRIEREGIFCYDAVARLLTEHRSGKRDHKKVLWSLLMFQMWRERWLI